MLTNFYLFEIWKAFTDEEYRDIHLASFINPADTPAQQLSSAKVHKMLGRLEGQQSVEVTCLENCLSVLVTEGILTASRVTEVTDALKGL